MALDPGRLGPLLEESGLVEDQDRRRIAQVLAHIGHQIVTHRVRVPARRIHEPLHAIGGALTRLLGQLPAILALGMAKQAFAIRQGAAPRLGPLKARRNPRMQGLQLARPVTYLGDAGLIRSHGCHGGMLLPARPSPPS